MLSEYIQVYVTVKKYFNKVFLDYTCQKYNDQINIFFHIVVNVEIQLIQFLGTRK